MGQKKTKWILKDAARRTVEDLKSPEGFMLFGLVVMTVGVMFYVRIDLAISDAKAKKKGR